MSIRPASASPAGLWEPLFHALSPAQQANVLTLAARQGVVYEHQIPSNGHVPHGSTRRSLLTTLLDGPAPSLAPVLPATLAFHDRDLDPEQRDAAGRAVACPDLFLLTGGYGTGKSRAAVEIVSQAVAQGERVLILAPTSAAVDRLLDPLAHRELVIPLRLLAPNETLASLPSCIAALTPGERVRTFREDTLPQVRRTAAAAQLRHESHAGDEATWERLETLADQIEHLNARVQESTADLLQAVLNAELAELDGEPRQTWTNFQRRVGELRQAHGRTLAHLDAAAAALAPESEQARSNLPEFRRDFERLDARARARQARHYFSAAWWAALFTSNLPGKLETARTALQQLEESIDRLTRQASELAAERAVTERNLKAEVQRLTELEATERRQQHDVRTEAVRESLQQASADWDATLSRLSEGSPRPQSPSREAVSAARQAWEQVRREDEQGLAFARRWLAGLEEAEPALPARLAAFANVVAGTPASLAGDQRFGERAQPPVVFDRLVLLDADHFTESEFQQAARRANRWILIGNPENQQPTSSAPPSGRNAAPGRAARPGVVRPSYFQRLWRSLHADPRQLPYRWWHRDGRLVCRLRPLTPDLESFVESERLVDRPDVELRIAAPPRKTPQLIEVLFPASTSIAQAKEIVYRETEEAALCPESSAFRWAEEQGRVVLRSDAGTADRIEAVELCPGVTEHVAATADGWATVAVAFDAAAGWDRERAASWVAERLLVTDLGRTAVLTAAHRPQPALAAFVADLLSLEATAAVPRDHVVCPGRAAVEFVAIPSLHESEPRGRADAEGRRREGGTATATAKLKTARGGAGVEYDLADGRRLEVIPADLRSALPPQGLVNYLEARAVVAAVEELAADPGFRRAAERWQQQHACSPGGPAHDPVLAVIALYPAQAQLIRLLLHRQSPPGLRVEVGTPRDFRERECLAAVVSLTRSHTHRAVTYGEGPAHLALGLTRASGHLLVFGDPGTLARRCQWQGAVDHLDEPAARAEREIVGRLLDYLHGHGPCTSAFRLREGPRGS